MYGHLTSEATLNGIRALIDFGSEWYLLRPKQAEFERRLYRSVLMPGLRRGCSTLMAPLMGVMVTLRKRKWKYRAGESLSACSAVAEWTSVRMKKLSKQKTKPEVNDMLFYFSTIPEYGYFRCLRYSYLYATQSKQICSVGSARAGA